MWNSKSQTSINRWLAISGGKPIKTLDELYEAAIITQPKYQDYVKELGNQVCEACGDSTETVDIEFASLKGKQRALKKASDDYSGRNLRPGISWLYDIVRGSIKFASAAKQVLECLEIMQSDEWSIYLYRQCQEPVQTTNADRLSRFESSLSVEHWGRFLPYLRDSNSSCRTHRIGYKATIAQAVYVLSIVFCWSYWKAEGTSQWLEIGQVDLKSILS